MEGNMIWFGKPLKEKDLEDLKKSKILFNRFPESNV